MSVDTDLQQIRLHQGNLLGVASQWDKVPWAIFRGLESSVSPICSPKSAEPTPQEKAYANALLNLVQTSSIKQPRQEDSGNQSTVRHAVHHQGIATVKKRDRFSLIKDLSLSPHTYVDLITQVVKTFREQDKFLLYVTDYTTNKALFDYAQSNDDALDRPGDPYGYISRGKRRWQGPLGQMTLLVTLWHPHAYFAQENVKEDSYVYLSNVHIKPRRDNGMMEGKIHTDRMFPEKICVTLIEDDDDDPRVMELKKRKREYWRRNKLDKAQVTKDFGNADGSPQESGSKKNAKKRKKEQQQKKEPVREEGQTEITKTLNINRYEPNRNSRFFSVDSFC